MGLFDDETSRVPADVDGPPSAPSRRRRPDRRRLRLQRLTILALVLFIVIFALAWWARSCQHNRKVESYRTYLSGVGAAVNDSTELGKELAALMADPGKLSRRDLINKLGKLSARQEEIAVRADRLEPPKSLQAEQTAFATGMRIRAVGYRLLRSAMVAALSNKKIGSKQVVALDGYFSGPDAYYQEQILRPTQEAMVDDGVAGVAVPTSTYYLGWNALESVTVDAMLDGIGKSRKLTGIHGVALVSVIARSSGTDVRLQAGGTTEVTPSADLAFVVAVQNQGNVLERRVPVTATLKLPGGETNEQSATIAAIDAGKTQEIPVSGFVIPETALSKKVTLTVEAGPVPGEAVETNNSATYKILLQLK